MSAAARCRRGVRRLLGDRSGIAAVEFALLLPIMMALYFGSDELGSALTINRKVTHVASTIADLVTQSKTISPTDMTNIFDAAAEVLSPYSDDPLTMRVSGLAIDSQNVAKVAWSQARNTTPLTAGTTLTIPVGVNQASTFLVFAEVHYPYTPTVGYIMTGTFDLNGKFYLRPRISDKVCYNATTC